VWPQPSAWNGLRSQIYRPLSHPAAGGPVGGDPNNADSPIITLLVGALPDLARWDSWPSETAQAAK